jgi:hypothetical protein
MALPQRNDIDDAGEPFLRQGAGDRRYEAGGHVAQLQADLARRLASEALAPGSALVASPTERAVRLLSVAGGYAALLAGYVAVAAAIAYWAA